MTTEKKTAKAAGRGYAKKRKYPDINLYRANNSSNFIAEAQNISEWFVGGV
ncbi:Uncharacterised protein [Salmonella enterica subsp. enterica serovar Bovismorbificans]|nr:Uncharacterised protein [Salmonella enterica subsp. enterica serovar Bovismorbificans]